LSRWRNLRAPTDRPMGRHEAAANQLMSGALCRSAVFGGLAPSGRTTLEDRTRSASGDHANEVKSAATEQGPVLGLGALASAATDEPHIEELVRVWLISAATPSWSIARRGRIWGRDRECSPNLQ